LTFHRWLDSQSAPRPGEPDRRCDTILELTHAEGPPWACVVELFTEPDADAIDRALEYLGRFRRELRHGPHGHDRYPFAVALVFLTGKPRETRLDMNLPGVEEVGLWFGPRVLDVSAEDAVAHLDAIGQNVLPRGLLTWLPLMRGGQTVEAVHRWRSLAEGHPQLQTMIDLVLTFARLTDCEAVWRMELEDMMVTVSPYMEEARLKIRRQDLQALLEARFPSAVPAGVDERVNAETDLAKLMRWIVLAGTSKSPEEFQAGMD
jgi:hypothetical protein